MMAKSVAGPDLEGLQLTFGPAYLERFDTVIDPSTNWTETSFLHHFAIIFFGQFLFHFFLV